MMFFMMLALTHMATVGVNGLNQHCFKLTYYQRRCHFCPARTVWRLRVCLSVRLSHSSPCSWTGRQTVCTASPASSSHHVGYIVENQMDETKKLRFLAMHHLAIMKPKCRLSASP